MRIALLIFGIVIGILILSIAWITVQHKIVYPWQYRRLQAEAAEWNETNWEKGHALRVTVQMTSGKELGAETATATLICYEKKFASPGSLKNGRPFLFVRTYSDGPASLAVTFGAEATLKTPLKDICRETLGEGEGRALPYVTESHYHWSMIEPNDKSYQCFLGNDPRTTRGKVTRPTFVAVEKAPLRDLLERDAYFALPERPENPVRQNTPTYYWLHETVESCWRERPVDPCAPEIEKVCGRVLR